MKHGRNVVCTTCGAARGRPCLSLKRPPGMPAGMLPLTGRTEVPSHRARLLRAVDFAIKAAALARNRGA